MYCLIPEETIDSLRTVGKPWVAFRVPAEGAIQPEAGLSHAWPNGADVVIVGMFDVQVAENAGLTAPFVQLNQSRTRPSRT